MPSQPLAFLAAGAIGIMIAAGCAKGSDQSSTSTTTTTTAASSEAPASAASSAGSSMSAAAGGAMGSPTHGKAIFTANCSSCHGATGTEGGVGPSLKAEKSRKNYEQAIAWIKNPQPPMPKLYPSPLSEKDVDDVASYVETL
jgi:mono/diheme cytochrome c family protein